MSKLQLFDNRFDNLHLTLNGSFSCVLKP